MKTFIIEACTDLGCHINGAHLGPDAIIKNENYSNIKKLVKENVEKSHDYKDVNKNLEPINRFNEELYNTTKEVIKDGYFPIILGGDHSLAIGSALGSIKENNKLGIIWIDAHGDFNTPKATPTGNIHGYPFAANCAFNNVHLTKFHNGNFYNPKNAVLVGARDIDMPYEYNNLKEAGVTIFTTDDINNLGVEKVMNEAFKIASNGTNGIHISYDLDSIDPIDAPGVSIPAVNGFKVDKAYEILKYLCDNSKYIKSMDIVEFNPTKDIDDKTLIIAKKILRDIVEAKENE